MPDIFEFKDTCGELQLNLCGKDFHIDLDEGTITKCRDILREAKRRLGQLKSGVKDECISDDGICRFLEKSIDGLIGSGSVQEVFGVRPINLQDLTQLMCYIVTRLRQAFTNAEKDLTRKTQ